MGFDHFCLCLSRSAMFQCILPPVRRLQLDFLWYLPSSSFSSECLFSNPLYKCRVSQSCPTVVFVLSIPNFTNMKRTAGLLYKIS
jgi:hypothetical protein